MAVTVVRVAELQEGVSYLDTNSASTTYLTKTSASTTYLAQTSASTTYLTQASASTSYLTPSSASTTYATKAAPVITGGATVTGDIGLTGSLTSTVKVTDSMPSKQTKFSTGGSSTNTMTITSTTWADITTTDTGTMSVSITTPYSLNVLISISGWLLAGPNTSAESVRISTAGSGATTWSAGGTNCWGNVLAKTGIEANNSYATTSSSFVVTLNAGTTTITMQGYRTGTGLTTSQISFPYLAVTPIAWA